MAQARQHLNGYAVDLGGTKIAAARITDGEIVARDRLATDGAAGPEAQVAAMAALVGRLGYRPGDRLGVAVAGRIDAAGHWHAVNSGTLSEIRSVPLKDMVRDVMGPAACLNDAAAAALAEARFGAGQGAANFAFLTVSTGIGGGLVLAGRLLTSASGLAGHVGFTSTPGGAVLCGSGRRGTVESVAGGRAIAAAALSLGHEADARAVSEAAAAGTPWADAIISRSATAIAILIADLTASLGIEAVAIGGSIGLSPGYLDRVRAALAAEPQLFRVPVVPAALGSDAPLLGALGFRQNTETR